jgi:hypothetical protein
VLVRPAGHHEGNPLNTCMLPTTDLPPQLVSAPPHCVRCGRKLRAKRSKALLIGPDCEKQLLDGLKTGKDLRTMATLPFDPAKGDIVFRRVPDPYLFKALQKCGSPCPEGTCLRCDILMKLEHETPLCRCGKAACEECALRERLFDTAGEIEANIDQLVVHHSPSGFTWGYDGSGPADFALNILNLFVPPKADGQDPVTCWDGGRVSAFAWQNKGRFRSSFLSRAPVEGSVIPGTLIRLWISTRWEEERRKGQGLLPGTVAE